MNWGMRLYLIVMGAGLAGTVIWWYYRQCRPLGTGGLIAACLISLFLSLVGQMKSPDMAFFALSSAASFGILAVIRAVTTRGRQQPSPRDSSKAADGLTGTRDS